MSRALLILSGKPQRDMAKRWVDRLPQYTRLEFRAPKRTTPQNDRLWAHCTDIARQCRHHGQKLEPDDWKILFMDALNKEARMVPALDGVGWINLGRSSSKLSVGEMADLITYIEAWAAREGVTLGDEFTSSEGPERANNPPGVAA